MSSCSLEYRLKPCIFSRSHFNTASVDHTFHRPSQLTDIKGMSSDEDELFRADTFPYPDSLRKLDLLDVLLHDDGSQQEGDELYVVAQHLGVRVKRRFRERIDPLETME